MAAGQFGVGDKVRVLSGAPSGDLIVVRAIDGWRKDPATGEAISGQFIKARQVHPAIAADGQVIIWPDRDDIVGGHWFDLLDAELELVAAAGTFVP